ncbi:MAG: N-acetylmuramic acid 6-phosphate etherase [Planctomycetota bacterium]
MVHESTTESVNPESEDLDLLSSLEFVRCMNAADALVHRAVAAEAEQIAAAIDQVAARLSEGGRLIYIGAGTSGRLAVLDAAECPPTFSSPPKQVLGLIAGGARALQESIEGAEDDRDSARRDLAAVELAAGDSLLGIAASGSTPYVLAGMEYARECGALTLGLSCNADSALSLCVDLPITVVVGPEILTGSTRLKAGTACKMVLNMLSTGVMVRLGKVYGNRMVDLKASNVKLTERSLRILSDLTDLDSAAAAEVLHKADGDVKIALICVHKGVEPTEAGRMLAEAGGRLREVIGT